MLDKFCKIGERIRQEKKDAGKIAHDAISNKAFSNEMIINQDGTFVGFKVIDMEVTPFAERISSKKGKSILVLDKAEEVLGYQKNIKKHQIFLDKLNEYKDLPVLKPIFAFYENKENGIGKALLNFESQVEKKQREGAIAFRIEGNPLRVHEEPSVYQEIIKKYDLNIANLLEKKFNICSICGETTYPTGDITHDKVRGVPKGQSTGCVLVSYNEPAYESYGLKGNNNCPICTHCAITHVEGLNYLLNNHNIGYTTKGKSYDVYTNCYTFGKDTKVLFWTKNNTPIDEIALFNEPNVELITKLFASVKKGNIENSNIDDEVFYSCTISGAVTRIVIRDWIEISLRDYKQSIVNWFKDIAIEANSELYYPSLYRLLNSINTKVSDDKNKKSKIDNTRIMDSLWNAALKGGKMPPWVLSVVLRIIHTDKGSLTVERIALLKFILNRNGRGGIMIKEKLDQDNKELAYMAGRIFFVLESIQRYAIRENINGIRERFFSSASMRPAVIFGIILKLTQHHLTKLKKLNPGMGIILDKELQSLFKDVTDFPDLFSLEEQGQFSIGYYHQKEEAIKKAQEIKKEQEIKKSKK